MRKTFLALFAGVLVVSAAMAAGQSDVTTPIHQFIDAFNKGDMNAASATYANGNITIVDEFAPHLWSGPHAGQDWATDFLKNAQAMGVTDPKVTYGAAMRVQIEGDLAYVVMPTGYMYKLKGTPMEEKAQLVVVLHKETGGWKLRGWAWSGMRPHPVK